MKILHTSKKFIKTRINLLLRISSLALAFFIPVVAVKVHGLNSFGNYLFTLSVIQIISSVYASHNKDIGISVLKIESLGDINIYSLFKHSLVTILQVTLALITIYLLKYNSDFFKNYNSNSYFLLMPGIFIIFDFFCGILVYLGLVAVMYIAKIIEYTIFVLLLFNYKINILNCHFLSLTFITIILSVFALMNLCKKNFLYSTCISNKEYFKIFKDFYNAGLMKTITKRLESPIVMYFGTAEMVATCKIVQQVFVPLSTIPEILVSQSVNMVNKLNFADIIQKQSNIGRVYFLTICIPTFIIAPCIIFYLDITIDINIIFAFILFIICAILIQKQWYARLITYIYNTKYIKKAALLYCSTFLICIFGFQVFHVIIAISLAHTLSSLITFFYWNKIYESIT